MSKDAVLSPILELQQITRSFIQGNTELHVLKGISLKVMPGEIIALTGASGAGKSTLLQIAGLLEPPTTGEVIIEGLFTTSLNDDKRTALRRRWLGFVYQFHHLLPEFTALENIMLPQMIAGVKPQAAIQRANHLLNSLGLAERGHHRPAQLSGGEQQRVAILRAIANHPRLLLADEPTGNLDEETADHVFNELLSLVRTHQIGAVIATHDSDLARRMDRTLRLSNGKLEQL
jgi:lipoprotein-releasing system ATP-binding protein